MELTEKEQKRLKELGWIDIEKKMLPLGEKVNVMRLVSHDHQQLWQQSFNSVAEVFASGVTHWAKEKDMKHTYCSQETANLLKNKGIELGEKPTLQEAWEWLYDKGIFISVSPYYATEEEPYRWEVNKRQEGHWGGSATHYAPEKSGDASSCNVALETAIKWTLENLV